MRLENLLKKFPHISLASRQNNDEILDFFNRFSLKDKREQVTYYRDPDFFALIKARGRESLTFLLREDSGELQGVAVVNFRPGYINGELNTVGYLGDLRVSLNRKLIRQWRNCFKEFIATSPQLEETYGCRHYQTALMDTNSHSKANLASNKIPGVHYSPLSKYHMVNVVGCFDLFLKKEDFTLSPLREGEREEVITFLSLKERELIFGHNYPEQLNYRIENWNGFSEENILVLRDKNEVVQGVTSFYDPTPIKRMSLSQIPAPLKLSSYLSKVIPFYHQSELPKPYEVLRVCYLENGFAKTPQALEVLYTLSLRYLLSTNSYHMVAVTEWEGHTLSQSLKGFIHHKTPMTLFTVHPINDQGLPLYTEDFSRENYPKTSFPRFDMAMV